jgi:hypothetical protein
MPGKLVAKSQRPAIRKPLEQIWPGLQNQADFKALECIATKDGEKD